MGEHGDGFDFKDISRAAHLFGNRASELFRQTELKLDKDAFSADETLSELAGGVGFLMNPANRPKVLEVKTKTREYISIRRVEATELENRYVNLVTPEDGDPNGTIFKSSIPVNFVGENQALVLVLPVTFDLKCKKPEVELAVLEKLGDKIDNYANFVWLAMMHEVPEMFRHDEWEPFGMDVNLLTRRNGKYYAANILKDEKRGIGYRSEWFRKVHPNREGRLEIATYGYFQSKEDMEANQRYLREWGRMYLLTEGSSQKQKGFQHNPSFDPVTTSHNV
jgi:hypothetical protein